ncbi:hypothetical protein [Nisaea sp.]|uniref:hypothetical protein n=1 Tax=Nisaea sp. TaxID=2024842 RepID=UPI0032EFF8ED
MNNPASKIPLGALLAGNDTGQRPDRLPPAGISSPESITGPRLHIGRAVGARPPDDPPADLFRLIEVPDGDGCGGHNRFQAA